MKTFLLGWVAAALVALAVSFLVRTHDSRPFSLVEWGFVSLLAPVLPLIFGAAALSESALVGILLFGYALVPLLLMITRTASGAVKRRCWVMGVWWALTGALGGVMLPAWPVC